MDRFKPVPPVEPGSAASSRRWILAAFVAALALLTVTALLGYRQSQRAASGYAAVSHTLDVQRRAAQLEAELLQMEAEHRAYLVRPEPGFLAARDRHRAHVGQRLAELRGLTRDNPAQQARLDAIASLLAERDTRMAATTDLVQGGAIDTARTRFDPAAKGSIAPLRRAIAGFSAAEAALFDGRSRRAADQAAQLRWLLLFGPGLGVALVGFCVFALMLQLRRSERLGRELAAAHGRARRALDMVDATHDGVFVYDAASLRITYANQGAVEQVGYPREELLGRPILAIKCDFDESGLRRKLSPLLAGAVDVLGFETRHRRKNGSALPVEVSMRARVGDDGSVSLVTIARDLSARRQAEDERDRFFDLSLDMLCIATPDGRFKRVSPAFTATLGWSAEELTSRPYVDFVHPDDQRRTDVETERLTVAGEPVLRFENRYRCKDGSWRVLSWKASPQPDGLIFATARDVTENRAAEQRIVALNRDLTERQAALEAANRELESFSYSVSHDLRAPLRHIDGYARMLAEDCADRLDPDARRYLQSITASAVRMGQLIDDLLALSRLGRKALEPQRIDMGRLVADALADLDAPAGAVTIGALPAAHGDAVLLRQLWANLLSNAIKYSAPRGADARIDVSGERLGGAVAYTVRDNGVGFDMRYADKLFGVFQRLHSQDQFEGTGVGLAIVQRIVTRHGGTIRASAEPDRGATFIFELPMAETEA